ncbi:DUF4249 domain-containing protein [Flavobacterium hauense]
MKNNSEPKRKASYLKYFLFLLIFSLLGCEDVIQVDLATGENKIVIDAEILWQKDTDGSVQKIKISRMAAYYDPSIPKVSGAEVYVSNSMGTQFVFIESDEPGVYVCTDFTPVLNETYSLYVKVDDEVYTAQETMMPAPKIERVEQRLTDDFGTEEVEVRFYFNDPENETNFYLGEFVTDVIQYPDYELQDDEFYNGNEMMNDFSHEDLKPGGVLDITLRGVSKQFYNYMDLILDATDPDAFSSPPANIRGNIINQTSQGSFALGYFRLCESDHVSYTVQ